MTTPPRGTRTWPRPTISKSGGDAALTAALTARERPLATLSWTSTGSRHMTGEGYQPTHRAERLSTFDMTATCDLRVPALRLDYTRRFRQHFFDSDPTNFSEVLVERSGALIGIETSYPAPGFIREGPLPSDRVASIWRQQELLNPHLLLNAWASGAPVTQTASPDRRVRVTVADDPPIDFEIGSDGRLAAARTWDNHPTFGDATIDLDYDDWVEVDGVWIARAVELRIAGEIAHRETRTAIVVDRSVQPDCFDAARHGIAVDDEAWRWGRIHHQFHQRFNATGHPVRGRPWTIVASELAPHVFHLTGGTHHTLVVDQGTGIVVLEAPLSVEIGEAVVAWIRRHRPGSTISHVVCTHHHDDHVGGLRAFVAAGATIVCAANARAYLQLIIDSPRTIRPDRLARHPRHAAFTLVADDPLTLRQEPNRPTIELYRMTNSHASDLVMAYLPEYRMLFHSDLYSPSPRPIHPGFRDRAGELRTNIEQAGLDVEVLVAGHGTGTNTYHEYLAKLAAAQATAPRDAMQPVDRESA